LQVLVAHLKSANPRISLAAAKVILASAGAVDKLSITRRIKALEAVAARMNHEIDSDRGRRGEDPRVVICPVKQIEDQG
jgi:hypothetical protein